MAVPVIGVEQMRAWEQATWSSGKKEGQVIRQVGAILAERIRTLTRPEEQILIVAGKGHNGDDALYCRSALPERNVRWIRVTSPDEGRQAIAAELESRRPAWIVEGLFGIGLNRPLKAGWDTLIEQLNDAGIPILSIDLPSGLNADSGDPQPTAIRATVTLTLGAIKAGLIKPSAIPYVGRLEVAPEIGLIPCPCESELYWSSAADFDGFPPRREVNSHKGSYGHLGILAGSLGFHGAAVLATKGALKAQPGLVTVHPQPEVYQPVAAQTQAAMVRPWKRDEMLTAHYTAFLVGPGLAAENLTEGVRDELQRLWKEAAAPVIVDASALDWLPRGDIESNALRLVTPHPGEAARMLEWSTRSVQAERIDAVRQISRSHGHCWVVLKGYQTVIGRSEGPCFINASGNPSLAQGGSGDILSGLLGGLLAQPVGRSRPEMAIRYGVWLHGAMGDWLAAERTTFTVEELLAAIWA